MLLLIRIVKSDLPFLFFQEVDLDSKDLNTSSALENCNF